MAFAFSTCKKKSRVKGLKFFSHRIHNISAIPRERTKEIFPRGTPRAVSPAEKNKIINKSTSVLSPITDRNECMVARNSLMAVT